MISGYYWNTNIEETEKDNERERERERERGKEDINRDSDTVVLLW